MLRALGKGSGGLMGLLSEMAMFLRTNRRLMLFLCLFIGGVIAGIALFLGAYRLWEAPLRQILTPAAMGKGLSGAARSVLSSCFSPGLLLLMLLLAGLSAYGLPVTLIVPFFYGVGLGVTEAYLYAAGCGVGYVAALVLPHSLLAATALLIAAAQSARFSLLLSGQLLPGSSRLGGLWQDFRQYLLKMLLCAAVVGISGILDVLLRFLMGGWVS